MSTQLSEARSPPATMITLAVRSSRSLLLFKEGSGPSVAANAWSRQIML